MNDSAADRVSHFGSTFICLSSVANFKMNKLVLLFLFSVLLLVNLLCVDAAAAAAKKAPVHKAPVKKAPAPSALKAGESLRSGHCLGSSNSRWRFCVRGDGNLAIWSVEKKVNHLKYFSNFQWADTKNSPYSLSLSEFNRLSLHNKNNKTLWAQTFPSPLNITANSSALHIDASGNVQLSHGKAVAWKISPIASVLRSGQQLYQGQCLVSKNGKFSACIGRKGQLAVRQGKKGLYLPPVPKFKSTKGKKAPSEPFWASLDSNNNFVIRSHNGATFSTRTAKGKKNSASLNMRNDGNLVLVVSKKAVWNSKAAEKKLHPPQPHGNKYCTINSPSLSLVKGFEGFRSNVYYDSVGVRTIGYGCTSACSGMSHISEPAAAKLLSNMLQNSYGSCVRSRVTRTLTLNQYGALTSFVYNLGCGVLSGSLLSNINSGNWRAATSSMLQYCHAGGQVLAGLVRRRQAEVHLFNAKSTLC
jgi:lysozyme